MTRHSDRFRAAKARRDAAMTRVDSALLDELWEASSTVQDRQSQAMLPPHEPTATFNTKERTKEVVERWKPIVAVIATGIGLAIAAAIQQMMTMGR